MPGAHCQGRGADFPAPHCPSGWGMPSERGLGRRKASGELRLTRFMGSEQDKLMCVFARTHVQVWA